MKTFFSLYRSNGVPKNPSFYTDFKNVHLTFVKSSPKNQFSGTFSIGKSVFCRRPDPRSSESAQVLSWQGFELMSSLSGLRRSNQRASSPVKIVRISAGISTTYAKSRAEPCTFERGYRKSPSSIIDIETIKAVSQPTNRQIETVERERESVAALVFFGFHYRISLSTITFEFRTIPVSVSVSPLIFLQRYRSSPFEIERLR